MGDGDVGLGNEKAALQVADIDFILQQEAYFNYKKRGCIITFDSN